MMFAYLSWEVSMRRELFGVTFFPHGVLIAVGFVAGSLLLRRSTRRLGLVADDVLYDILFWVAVGSLVGTRLFWALGNWSQLSSPAEVLMIWKGGMTLYGGIAGGLVGGVVLLRRHRLPVLTMVDLAMPGLALGLLIGRISDLITGDHLGKPTDRPWGFRYVGTDPPGQAPTVGQVVHFVALYDVVLVAILLVALLWFARRPRAAGSVAALFALYYSVDRIALDFLRVDPARAFGLTGTQLVSVAVVAVVSGWLLVRRRADGAPTAAAVHGAAGPPSSAEARRAS